MAPAQPARPDKEKRMKTILSFASDLEAQLPTAITSRTAPLLLQGIENQLSWFPSKPIASAAPRCEELDSRGTTLWNLCTRLRRGFDADKSDEVPPILLAARVFAFLLLDCACENGKSAPGNFTRLMKIGIKAAKSCLEKKELELALKVLEKVSGYEETLLNPDVQIASDDRDACEPLVAEYYVLRTALAWHQGQFKLAEHMFNKSTTSQRAVYPHTVESLADVLYEMGKDLLEKKEYQMAVKWLDRAYEVLASQELDRLSTDASELRTSIIQSTIKALLGLNNTGDLGRARNLIDLLENEIGGKLIVSILKLEVLSMPTDEVFDSNSYADVLQRMTRSLVLNNGNFKLIMFHIRKLNDNNPTLACTVLGELLSSRVLKEGPQERIEKILVTRLYMIAGQRDSEDILFGLREFFALIAANIAEPISSAACLAVHTLLWKRIESNYSQGQYDVAEKWCRLAMQKIFEKSGEVNMARISRKLLLCALGRQDIGSARDIFGTMSEVARDEPMTRFLMYKIAIRCGEIEIAAECLQIISSSSSEDPTLLYACCLDAQQVGNRSQTLAALLLVLEKYGYGAVGTIHLPSLLRTTLGLMVTTIEGSKSVEGSAEMEAGIEKLCKVFEGAVASIRKSFTSPQTAETLWTVLELDWFSKNSYNLGIKHISSWNPRHSLRILVCCIEFIDHYPDDISENTSEDLALRKMFCEFSSATALIALARGEDNIEMRLQDYLDVRKHVESFDNLLQDRLEKMEEVSAQDLLQKLSILATFDFEAACQLKAWGDLGEVVLKAAMCKSMRVYQLMADCLLCSQTPTPVLITTMKKIINEAWGLEELDFVRLAKYMRCLFQVAISDNSEIAEQLLDQVHEHAEQASETNQCYPTEELEWVATTAFNHAVDLYCGEKDEAAKNWAYKAVNVAHFCSDGGALERLLQDKLVGLKFDS